MAADDSLLLSMSALVSPIAIVSVTIKRRSLLLLRAVSTRGFKAIVLSVHARSQH